jgi:peptidoglycan hydrolase-like protein with peptidoglycan-binding domain
MSALDPAHHRQEGTTMDEPRLTHGSHGEWVTYLQQLLEAAGHSPGAIDGDFGPATNHAVRAYQAAHGLAADGVVGEQTWRSLTAAAPGGDGAGDAGQGDVPPELVQAGAPADLAQWTEEQKEAFFEGSVDEAVEADTPEDVPLLAMSDATGDGSEYA